MESNRRQFIAGGGSTLASIAALSAPAAASTHGSPQSADGDSHAYPVLGADADAPVLTVYGSFNCPYTAQFVASSLDDIVEEFVEPGRLTLEFRTLEYEADGGYWISRNGALAGQAATGVWERDADSYWDFFAELWSHMPGQVDQDTLAGLMRDAGVEGAGSVADDLESWDDELRATARAADEAGVQFTPTLVLDGDRGNRHGVLEWIERRLDDAPTDDADGADAADGTDGTREETGVPDDAGQGEDDAADGVDVRERTTTGSEETTGGTDAAAGGDSSTTDDDSDGDDVPFCPF